MVTKMISTRIVDLSFVRTQPLSRILQAWCMDVDNCGKVYSYIERTETWAQLDSQLNLLQVFAEVSLQRRGKTRVRVNIPNNLALFSYLRTKFSEFATIVRILNSPNVKQYHLHI